MKIITNLMLNRQRRKIVFVKELVFKDKRNILKPLWGINCMTTDMN